MFEQTCDDLSFSARVGEGDPFVSFFGRGWWAAVFWSESSVGGDWEGIVPEDIVDDVLFL